MVHINTPFLAHGIHSINNTFFLIIVIGLLLLLLIWTMWLSFIKHKVGINQDLKIQFNIDNLLYIPYFILFIILINAYSRNFGSSNGESFSNSLETIFFIFLLSIIFSFISFASDYLRNYKEDDFNNSKYILYNFLIYAVPGIGLSVIILYFF